MTTARSGIRPRVIRLPRLVVVLVMGALSLSIGGVAASSVWTSSTGNTGSSLAATATFPRCYLDDVVADAPVSLWRLDEASGTSAADARGTNAGTYVGSPALSQSGALADSSLKAMTVNGSGQYVQVPDSTSLDTGDVMTLELWVKRGASGSTQALLDKGPGSYRLQFNANDLVQLTQAGVVIATATLPINDTSVFHHVVATKNAGTVKIYIDGVDRTGSVSNSTLTNSADPLHIGAASPTPANYSTATIDEVAIYSTALSASRVLAHYQAARCYVDEPAADSPAARWRLDDPAGSGVALDDINGRNGLVKSGVTLGQSGAIRNDTNKAMTFNGTSGYVQVPYSSALNPNVWAVEAWAYPTGGSGTVNSVVTSRDSRQTGYSIFSSASNTWQLQCGLNGSWSTISGPATRLNEWTHLVGSYDGTTLRFYVNGVAQTPATVSCASQVDRPLRIGAGATEDDVPATFFPGSIDDVAVYNSAISATRVSAHYITGSSYRDLIVNTTPSPISYWRLGESSGTNAVDEKAANAGTYTASPILGLSGALAGSSSSAVSLDGTSQYVNVADSNSLDMGDVFTAEAWVKRGTTQGTDQRILTKGKNAWSVRFSAGNAVQLWKNRNAGDQLIVTSTNTITDTSTFHHIVVTKNAGSIKIYVDAVDVTGTVSNQAVQNNNEPFRIGAASPTASNYLHGVVDEVAHYSSVLSAAQVQLHYQAGRYAPR